MVELTPSVTGITLAVMIIIYIVMIAYSIYMAILNHKQAKVREELIETNKILKRIEEKINN